MANTEQRKGPKVPSRAASLQRMLEIERKQKMARMQQNPYAAGPGRRSDSPSARPKSNLLTRRRDSSQPPQDDRRKSTAPNYNLPPLTVHPLPTTQDRFAKQAGTRPGPLREMRKASADRDSLPSVVRATGGQGSPQVKSVTFLPSDDGQSDTSSICHSPTWDDYGKKKRKDKEAAAASQTKLVKKRLTKEPPPAAMDTRPTLNPRTMSAPLLDRMSLEDTRSADQPPPDPQPETSRPQVPALPVNPGSVETTQTAVRSPAFIGGVRLEREREAAMQRLTNSRAPSAERPVSEMVGQNQTSRPASSERSKKPGAISPTSYPPTASKTPLLNQPPPGKGHARKRSGSLGSVVSKLFHSSKNSEDLKPYLDRRGSQDSVQTVSSLFTRGRKRSDSANSQARAQSYDVYSRSGSSTPMSERRGALSLPPLAWKNGRKGRTTSMMAIPPDSARDGSFPLEDTNGLKQDNFTFLERPFSPPIESPLSPPASLSASIKAKRSPQLTPATTAKPVTQAAKKTFKDAIKAGFRSSTGPEIKSSSHRRTGTDDTLIDADLTPTLPSNTHPLPNSATAGSSAKGGTTSASAGTRGSNEHPTRQQAPDSKDSGASSSSSHPDTESIPPSPMTTPDTSRPQSLKDGQPLRVDELRKTPLVSTHGASGLGLQNPSAAVMSSSSNLSSRANSPRIDIELSTGDFNVKTSFQDLGSPLSDIEPLSLDSDPTQGTKVTFRGVKVEVVKSPAYAKKAVLDAPSPTKDTSFLPALRHQPLPPRGSNGRPAQTLVTHNEVDERPFPNQEARAESPDSFQAPGAASRHLQEARKAAPSSPRSPTAMTSGSSSTSLANSIMGPPVPRSFALAANRPKPSGGPAVPSLRHSNLDTTGLKPIAKMFVECCSCKFYQDMPSRVYEAMARPEDTVRDKRLGVSGQVTTCVKCPWCSHNMSTQCCAGYAAVVYLREKLHGP
ncbi:hypothetical protein INS49_002177 [Diaporthe citri]|uniref:uncharacterized protein n=1 Tax=Diaporthe citri TaxID=83186 RepID=UPI001C7FADDF|nr:uncharacterized protein INS49_002177 [Diaporthe citri]KAG6367977.1 hypothetical protein INS49_002177 [Diaporthe citri]